MSSPSLPLLSSHPDPDSEFPLPREVSVRRLRRLNAYARAAGYTKLLRVRALVALPDDMLLPVLFFRHQGEPHTPPNLRLAIEFPEGYACLDLPLEGDLVTALIGRGDA
jgi:hypothetical protein